MSVSLFIVFHWRFWKDSRFTMMSHLVMILVSEWYNHRVVNLCCKASFKSASYQILLIFDYVFIRYDTWNDFTPEKLNHRENRLFETQILDLSILQWNWNFYFLRFAMVNIITDAVQVKVIRIGLKVFLSRWKQFIWENSKLKTRKRDE